MELLFDRIELSDGVGDEALFRLMCDAGLGERCRMFVVVVNVGRAAEWCDCT